MKNIIDNITGFLTGNIDSTMTNDQQTYQGASPYDGHLISAISQINEGLGNVPGGHPLLFQDLQDNKMPVATPLRNLTVKSSGNVSVYVNAADVIKAYQAVQATIASREYVALTEVTVAGPDVVPPGFTDYMAFSVPTASPLRTAMVALAVQVRAKDTQNNTSTVGVQIPGVSTVFRYDLKNPNETAEFILYPNAPIYEGRVGSLDGIDFTFSNPANTTNFRLGFDSTTTNPNFVVAAVTSDILYGFGGTNVEISVMPIYPTGDDLAALSIVFSRD
jgi:hypothetical protein